jgi:hypothetical protein
LIAQDDVIKKDAIDIGYIGKERPYKIQLVTTTNLFSKKKTKAVQIEYYNLGDNDFLSQFAYIPITEISSVIKSIALIKNATKIPPKSQSELHYASKTGFKISATGLDSSWILEVFADLKNPLSGKNIDGNELDELYKVFQKAKLMSN